MQAHMFYKISFFFIIYIILEFITAMAFMPLLGMFRPKKRFQSF